MNDNIIEFYKKVRTDDELIAAFADAESATDTAKIAVREGAKLGLYFTEEEAAAAAINIDALRAGAVNDDELNEFELEMIAAGAGPSTTTSDL